MDKYTNCTLINECRHNKTCQKNCGEKNIGFFIDTVIKYSNLHHQLFGIYDGELMRKPNQTAMKIVSGTFQDFLEREQFHALIPLFLISHSSQGYGFIDEIGALYGLMWNTPKFVISLALRILDRNPESPKNTYNPKENGDFILVDGFEKIWNTIVKRERLDIVYNVDIKTIDRNERNVKIKYEDASAKLFVQTCDFLIWTPPMPELLKRLSAISATEFDLFSTLSHHVFAASLMRAKNTARNTPISYYSQTISDKIEHAVTADIDVKGSSDIACNNLNVSRYDKNEKDARLITVLQLGRTATNEAHLNDVARNHYEKEFHATDVEIFNTITWPYFYKWDQHEVAKGNHWKVFDLQGHQRTWYAGASVSFESVKSVMEYNNLLLRQLGINL